MADNSNNSQASQPQTGLGPFQFGPEFMATFQALQDSDGWHPLGVMLPHDKLQRLIELAVEDGVRHGMNFAMDSSATNRGIFDSIRHLENLRGLVQNLQAERSIRKGRVSEFSLDSIVSGDEELLVRLRNLIPGYAPQPQAPGAGANPSADAGPSTDAGPSAGAGAAS